MSTGSGHVNRFWPCQQVLAMSTGSGHVNRFCKVRIVAIFCGVLTKNRINKNITNCPKNNDNKKKSRLNKP
jgi:hypothetical protein